MKLDKKLSIIIPCYNVEKYIAECLESVCNDKDADVEVICVNDGSVDDTLRIIEQWKQKDDRIIIANQENKGAAAARNKGLNIAKGEFIYFLDSDDKVSDVAILKKCCEQMKRDNLEILIGAARTFYEFPELQNKFPEFEKRYHIEHEYPPVMKGTELMAEMRRNGEWTVSPPMRIYKREFLQVNNIHYTEGKIYEDNYVSFLGMYLAERTTAVKEILYERRVRENSIMTQKVTHRNVESYLVNFIQDLYLIAEYRDVKKPNMGMDFPLDIARREIKRTYRLLDEDEKRKFEECLTEEQKFYFDVLIRREIEVVYMLDAKSRLLERTVKENKEMQKKQESRIRKLEEQVAKLEEDKKQEHERNEKHQKDLQKKIKEANNDFKKANKKLKELKASNSWKIGRAITWPVRKLKAILRKLSNGNA